MNLNDLLDNLMIEKVVPSNPDEIRKKMEIAIRDVRLARKHLDRNDPDEWDGAYNTAFNAMLQAGTALMGKKGYRPKGREHHYAVTQCVAVLYPKQFSPTLLQAFEKGRKRRNIASYDEPHTVTFSEAETIIQQAEEFIDIAIRTLDLPLKRRAP